MKTRKSILALVVLLVLVFMQGQAGAAKYFLTGNDLVKTMRAFEKTVANISGTNMEYIDSRDYIGYVSGVYDAMEGRLFESPDGTTVGQTCSIVAKYLKNHPERWNESAADLVVDALKEAFPLPKKK